MNINLLHSIFSWIAIIGSIITTTTIILAKYIGRTIRIIGAILTTLAIVGTKWTGKIIEKEKEAKISSLQNELKIVQPRHLSSDQKTRLLSKLSAKKGKVGFIIRAFDGESADFAEEIATAFRSAGWEVVPTNRSYLDDSPGFLNILLTSKNLEETANFIIQSFKEINIDCHPEKIREGSLSGVFQPGTVYVVVGRK